MSLQVNTNIKNKATCKQRFSARFISSIYLNCIST